MSHLGSSNSHLTGPINSSLLLALPISYQQGTVGCFPLQSSLAGSATEQLGSKKLYFRGLTLHQLQLQPKEQNRSRSHAFLMVDSALSTAGRLQIHISCYHGDLTASFSSWNCHKRMRDEQSITHSHEKRERFPEVGWT